MLHNYENNLNVEDESLYLSLLSQESEHLEEIQEILNNLIFHENNIPPFSDVQLVAKAALMSDERVIFGEMPEITY